MDININDKAPEFTLPDQNGEPVSLKDFRGQWVVLYFYPRADTPGCTIEACEFRDSYKKMQKSGAVLLGISPDTSKAQKKFQDKFSLPFTLLADADSLYDPTDYNDRLLLGLTGIMSEAELHILKERMYQGKLNKARRGELYGPPPIGYVRIAGGPPVLYPDEQVQAVVRLIFDQFERQGTLHGLLRYLVHHGIRLPVRPPGGPNRGQLEWRRPSRALLSGGRAFRSRGAPFGAATRIVARRSSQIFDRGQVLASSRRI